MVAYLVSESCPIHFSDRGVRVRMPVQAHFYSYSTILSVTRHQIGEFYICSRQLSPGFHSIPFHFLDSVFILSFPSATPCQSVQQGSRRIPRESMQSISVNDRKNSIGCIPFLYRSEWPIRSPSPKLTFGFLTVFTLVTFEV